ncbi:hypothetical protein ABEB36_013976 [Hypothenemus hampei]|uniref:Uncharacterized protein n=1 Tax=Hypothenemus hampei TaxID=57062 RepID=A0ABD1E3S7_HYPHA
MNNLGRNILPEKISKMIQRLFFLIQVVLTGNSQSLNELASMANRIVKVNQTQVFRIGSHNEDNLVPAIAVLSEQVVKLGSNKDSFIQNYGKRRIKLANNQGG